MQLPDLTFYLVTTAAVMGLLGNSMHAALERERQRTEEARQTKQRLEQTLGELQCSKSRLRMLLAKVQWTQDEERTRLSRDVHDHLGQYITALKLEMNSIYRRIQALEASPTKEQLLQKTDNVREFIERITQAIRTISHQLRPFSFTQGDELLAAIKREFGLFQQRTGINCTLTPEIGEGCSLPPETASEVFRIFQEMMTNVERHAHAQNLQVRLACGERGLTLEVSDDGIGISPERECSPQALGILGMRERAAMLNGTISFSREGRPGTTAVLHIPEIGNGKHSWRSRVATGGGK